MSKTNRQLMIVLLLILIASAFFVIPQLNTKLLFSISISDLQKSRIPYINHNSRISESKIGDIKLITTPIQFICQSEIATLTTEKRVVTSGGKEITQTVFVPSWKGAISVPNPRNECWLTFLEWDNQKYSFFATQKRSLNKYVNVTASLDGSFVTFDVEQISYEPRDDKGRITGSTIREWVTYYGIFKNWEDEKRTFWFEVDNSFLSAEWKGESGILRLGSDDKPTLIVTNDLINNMDGELLIKTTKMITKEEKIISIPIKVKKGINEYKIDLPKETLKGLKTETEISVDFLGVKIFSDSSPKKIFNIIPNINPEENLEELITSVETGAVDVTPYLEPPGKIRSTNNNIVVILALMIFVFMILIRFIKR